jgi:hypothetical protein
MKTTRFISTASFYITRVLALAYLATGSYAALALICYRFNHATGLMSVADQHFEIYYPATKTGFLIGDYEFGYIASSLAVVFLYGLFFWLLGDVFTAFRQHKLFTVIAVKQLSRFYLFNIIAPPVVLLLMAIFSIDEVAAKVILVLHFVIGIFAYFMAAIFKQGLSLQEQQDFTI